MSWIYLVCAGLLEMVWGVSIKFTHGFTRLVPSVVTIAAMAASFLLLSHALKTLPLGVAYAIWTGIGTIGITAASILFLGESMSLPQILCVGLILAGIVGLKMMAA